MKTIFHLRRETLTKLILQHRCFSRQTQPPADVLNFKIHWKQPMVFSCQFCLIVQQNCKSKTILDMEREIRTDFTFICKWQIKFKLMTLRGFSK